MKISAIRQLIVDLPDDYDVFFITDNGEEHFVDASVPIPEYNSLYFGETQEGAELSLMELIAQVEDEADMASYDDGAEPDDDDDEDPPVAQEGSDLPIRTMCELPSDRTPPDNDSVVVEEF